MVIHHSNARLEGLNGIFQAAKGQGSEGYRNVFTFITMIYFIAAKTNDRLFIIA
jgi:transposase